MLNLGKQLALGRAVAGVTTRFVQNCMLSCAAQEHRWNIAQWPEIRHGIVVGPNVVAGQGDVLPAQGRDMGKEIVGDRRADGARVLDSAMQVDRIPMDNRGGDQT